MRLCYRCCGVLLAFCTNDVVPLGWKMTTSSASRVVRKEAVGLIRHGPGRCVSMCVYTCTGFYVFGILCRGTYVLSTALGWPTAHGTDKRQAALGVAWLDRLAFCVSLWMSGAQELSCTALSRTALAGISTHNTGMDSVGQAGRGPAGL